MSRVMARPEVLERAQDWLAHSDIDTVGMSSGEVLELVARYFDGGLENFERGLFLGSA